MKKMNERQLVVKAYQSDHRRLKFLATILNRTMLDTLTEALEVYANSLKIDLAQLQD